MSEHEVATRRSEPDDHATMRYWIVRLAISEQGNHVWARATLRDGDGAAEVGGTGRATCAPGEVGHRRIGEDLAVARALHALADQLLERVSAQITLATGEQEVSLRSR